MTPPSSLARRPRARAAHGTLPLALGLALVGGCVGHVGDPGAPPPPPGTPPAAGADAGARETTPSSCEGPLEPAPAAMRRLTNREYARTVRDLLGTTTDPTDALPPDGVANGFDNNAQSALSRAHVQGYLEAAERAVGEAFARPALRDALVGCDPSGGGGPACLRAFLARLGRRAYRRPLGEEDLAPLVALAEAAADPADPYAGASAALQGMLQSPEFLYRPEVGEPDPARPGLRRLGGFELAARLSYMVLGAGPDDALLDAAEAGRLDTPDGLEAAARALLDDPRARAGMRDFYTQWLRLTSLPTTTRDGTVYPAWGPALARAALEETARLVDDKLFTPGADFLDVLTAPYTYLDASLAGLYGLPAPATEWSRVEFGPGVPRVGLLTHASLLAVTSHANEPSVTRRGLYVRDVLLCDPLPPPPPNVQTALPEARPGETERERVTRHVADPACAGCHTRLDPIGFGLLRYDATGAYHEADALGRPIDARGEVAGLEPAGFDGPAGLARALRGAPEVSRCVTVQFFRFALGREPAAASERCAVRRLEAAFAAAGHQFPALVAALVRSDAFRYVRPEAATPGGP